MNEKRPKGLIRNTFGPRIGGRTAITLALTLASGVGNATLVRAQALTANGYYLYYYNGGPNSLGFESGESIVYGADNVAPVTGTTGMATIVDSGIQLPIANNAFFGPNLFIGGICTNNCPGGNPYNPPGVTGPWTISFDNPTTTPTAKSNTFSLVGSQIPFANSIALSGTTLGPTFSWTAPSGTSVDGYRIVIFQDGVGQLGAPIAVPAGMTSYTVSPQELSLSPNVEYTIEVDAVVTRNGSTTNFEDANVAAESAIYSNFEIPPPGSPPIQLPTKTLIGNQIFLGFSFSVASEGVNYYLDPEVAAGYIYTNGAGNPNFASVELPNIGNPNPYDLYLWNGTSFVFDTTLAAGTAFDFAPGGVSEFEIRGIDPDLGLDPNNPTAFITDVTFTGAGSFTGTMTPIIVSIPEPSTWALLALGFAGLGLAGWRRRAPEQAAAA
jgi:PEP-CTERM motif